MKEAYGYPVTGAQYRDIDQLMCKIKRQLIRKEGSPLDPKNIARELRRIGNPESFPATPEPMVFVGSAKVVYRQPAFKALVKKFDKVDHEFAGTTFVPTEVCAKVSLVTRDIRFEYLHFAQDVTEEQALVEMAKRHVRPVLYEEGLGFARRFHNELRKFTIVVLGSVTTAHNIRCFACLDRFGEKRQLRLTGFGPVFREYCRFLVTPIAKKAA